MYLDYKVINMVYKSLCLSLWIYLLCSCSKDENPNKVTDSDNYFDVLVDSLSVLGGGENVFIPIRTNLDYDIEVDEGDENWDKTIPTKGKAAEKGCHGCPWYDIEEWRKQLLSRLKNSK